MLSRVAEALFWVGRYVERAEDTARLLDVHFHEALENPDLDEPAATRAILQVLGADDSDVTTTAGALDLLAYDRRNAGSIVGSLVAAHQNARGVREALSAEIWRSMNATHNELDKRVAAARSFGPAPFFNYVRDRAATIAGYTEATMSRDLGYDCLVLGRSVERVDMTARLLTARLSVPSANEGWVATLQACSAHEAYLRSYQRGVEPRLVLEFLLLDRLFPRSVFFALTDGEQALARLDPHQGRGGLDDGLDHSARLALGQALTDLEFLSSSALLDGLPERLNELQRGMSRVNDAVTRRFFSGTSNTAWSLEESQW
jgi:uncharacterized alpha-E superfamily protein